MTAPAYLITRIRQADLAHPEFVEYLTRIQSTLDPFSGRFLVQGGTDMDEVEGRWGGIGVVVLEFPDRPSLDRWYRGDAYQAILPLRQRHSEVDVILVGGVPSGHDPASVATRPR
jgi:uncharacterized protein (DUF1330 family)